MQARAADARHTFLHFRAMAEPLMADGEGGDLGQEIDRYEVSVTIVWHRAARLTLSSTGKTVRGVSSLPPEPGVYRIRINRDGRQVHSYKGQAVNVRRRLSSHNKHHPEIRAALQAGGDVNVQVDLV